MGVESQAVQIEINVVDRNSAQAFGNVRKEAEALGEAGVATGAKVAAGMQRGAAGAKHFTDSFYAAQGASRLLAGQLPTRAFERFIAKSDLASKALMTLFPLMGAIGTIDIGIRAAEGLHSVYENWLDVDGAIEKYNKEAGKAAAQKFDENRSLEDLNSDLIKANDLVTQLNQKRANSPKWYELMMSGAAPSYAMAGAPPQRQYFSMKDAGSLNAAQGKTDEAQLRTIEEMHKKNLARIEDEKTIAESRVIGIRKARVEEESADKVALENRRYRLEVAGQLATVANRGKSPDDPEYRRVDANSGAADLEIARGHARAQFAAKQTEEERAQAQELAHLRAEALEAGMRGEQLYRQQEADAIEALQSKDIDRVKAREYIEQKFHGDQMKRYQEEEFELQKMHRQTALAGTSGAARNRQEALNQITDIWANPNSNMDPGQRLKAGFEIWQQHLKQAAADQQTFAQHVDEITDRSAEHAMGGFARIHAEAEREIKELNDQFKQYGGEPGVLAKGEAGIRKSEADQVAGLRQKNREETERIESEARAKFLSAEKQQTAAIDAEYEDRLQRLHEQLVQKEILEDDYNRRVLAAAQLRDAQMEESARQAREKMAGQFTQFFRNPMQTLKEFGDKAAGEAAAAMFQRLQGRFSPSAGTHGIPMPGIENWSGAGFGGVFAKLAGHPHSTNAAHGPTSELAAVSAISLASAEIRVQSANIAFGGASAAVGSTAPGSSMVGGSTSLLSLPGTFGEAGTASPAFSESATGRGGMSFGSSGGTVAGGGTNPVGQGLGDLQQGVSLFQQAKGIFAPGTVAGLGGQTSGPSSILSGAANTDSGMLIPEEPLQQLPLAGKSTTSGFGSSLLGGGGMGAVGGAAGGALGLYSAYQGNGGVGGALGGAMSGMELGMAVGGPIGVAVGLAAGAIIGAIGFGGREKGRVYDLKQVRPRLGNDFQAYEVGSMDYTTAYSDMQSLDQQARKDLDKMGGSARAYYWDTINKEIHQAEGKLTAEQKAGRSQFTAVAGQYEAGTDRVPATGVYMLHQDESVYTADRTDRTEAATRALEAAADHNRMPALTGFGGDVHMHVHAIDVKGVKQFFDENKHYVRSAINNSYMENSGGSAMDG